MSTWDDVEREARQDYRNDPPEDDRPTRAEAERDEYEYPSDFDEDEWVDPDPGSPDPSLWRAEGEA